MNGGLQDMLGYGLSALLAASLGRVLAEVVGATCRSYLGKQVPVEVAPRTCTARSFWFETLTAPNLLEIIKNASLHNFLVVDDFA